MWTVASSQIADKIKTDRRNFSLQFSGKPSFSIILQELTECTREKNEPHLAQHILNFFYLHFSFRVDSWGGGLQARYKSLNMKERIF